MALLLALVPLIDRPKERWERPRETCLGALARGLERIGEGGRPQGGEKRSIGRPGGLVRPSQRAASRGAVLRTEAEGLARLEAERGPRRRPKELGQRWAEGNGRLVRPGGRMWLASAGEQPIRGPLAGSAGLAWTAAQGRPDCSGSAQCEVHLPINFLYT